MRVCRINYGVIFFLTIYVVFVFNPSAMIRSVILIDATSFDVIRRYQNLFIILGGIIVLKYIANILLNISNLIACKYLKFKIDSDVY